MNKKKFKKLIKKTWHFIWEDDSIWSWIANIIIAFILIKFIVYPGLGFVLSTSHPVVAVVSSSMEHKTVSSCIDGDCKYTMCGNVYEERKFFELDEYWEECGSWYIDNTDIDENEFSGFSFKNGFDKGDIMFLKGANVENIEAGDTIVFRSDRKDPIIHRVVKKSEDDGIYFQTKGDNNEGSIKSKALDETKIGEDIIIGKAVFRVPFLGYIKIWFVEFIEIIF
tara:strand:- start:2700 stop:3371 length:672 start_codon:yes stop_codon:yes gene_type:complete